MAGQKSNARLGVDLNTPHQRSPSPSPSRKKKNKKATTTTAAPPAQPSALAVKPAQVAHRPAVKDNDIFNLPASDYNVLFLLMVVAVGVRLFRIYQPSSVVFDEVQ